MKPTIIAIVGPTGSGKTATSIRLCQRLNGEIVSMDSMQVYKRMDIGTAKPTAEQLSTVPHHMISIIDPDTMFTVSDYRSRAMSCIDDILAKGKLPVLVGGTGLYLNAISYEMNMGESGADAALRAELNAIAEQQNGASILHKRLMAVDPVSAEKLHENDIRRVIRALEVFYATGKTISAMADHEKTEGPYHVLVYGLSLPRDQMYARINQRVDEMIADGLVDEVKRLLDSEIEPKKEGGSMQAIGYKEIVSALRGEMSLDQAISLIKQGSRRYAKRQWTWFRHDPRTVWFDWTDYENADALIDALGDRILKDLP